MSFDIDPISSTSITDAISNLLLANAGEEMFGEQNPSLNKNGPISPEILRQILSGPIAPKVLKELFQHSIRILHTLQKIAPEEAKTWMQEIKDAEMQQTAEKKAGEQKLQLPSASTKILQQLTSSKAPISILVATQQVLKEVLSAIQMMNPSAFSSKKIEGEEEVLKNPELQQQIRSVKEGQSSDFASSREPKTFDVTHSAPRKILKEEAFQPNFSPTKARTTLEQRKVEPKAEHLEQNKTSERPVEKPSVLQQQQSLSLNNLLSPTAAKAAQAGLVNQDPSSIPAAPYPTLSPFRSNLGALKKKPKNPWLREEDEEFTDEEKPRQ